MTAADYAAALFLAGVLCAALLFMAGLAAFLEATPERKAWADRVAERVFGR